MKKYTYNVLSFIPHPRGPTPTQSPFTNLKDAMRFFNAEKKRLIHIGFMCLSDMENHGAGDLIRSAHFTNPKNPMGVHMHWELSLINDPLGF
jgi:hypothetical protein